MSPCHWSGGFGGAEQQMSLLLDALIPQQVFDVTYLTRQAGAAYRPAGYTIETIPFNPLTMRVGNLLDARPLLKALGRIRPHVIYQRVGGAYTGVAAWYARRNGCKMVWHISSDMNVVPFWADQNKSSNVLSRYLEKKALEYGIRHSDSIIAQTHRQADLLWANYGVKATTIIPNYQPVPEATIKQATPVSVLWVSNLKPMKRPEIFVDIARKYAADTGVRFTMVGRSDQSAWCRQLLDNIKSVRSLDYVGEKTQDEVNELLAKAHIFINTSSYEGFPNTFIQAWVREVPVISLDVDPDNILTTHQIGFCSGSFDVLLDNVKRLINDASLRRSMGAAARQYAINNHSEINIVSIIRELIDK